MKFTKTLFRQHIGRYLKKHWMVQGKKAIYETPAFKVLEKCNIPVYEATEIVKEERKIEQVEIIGYGAKPITYDNTHPNWSDKICLTFKDNNVLLEGLKQAQRLTKTVIIQDGLPENYVFKDGSKELDLRVKTILMDSHIFDAEQKKLCKQKDPERPAFNFPRIYGITNERRMNLLNLKLLQLIESLSGPQISNLRFALNNTHFKYSFEKAGDQIQFDINVDTFLTANTALQPLTENRGLDCQLPDLHPVKDTVTLNSENIYEFKSQYALPKHITKRHPHTIFINYDAEFVKNIHEEPVTEDQFLSRSLVKTFAVASSYAQQEYGGQIKELPKPVTVQCVHTDGRLFHFGVLQLNTLDLETTDGARNIWYQTPRIPMFELCAYVQGKPTLKGYNSDVIKYLMSFYGNNSM